MGRITARGPSIVNLRKGGASGSFVLAAANGDTFSLVFNGTAAGSGNAGDPASFQGTGRPSREQVDLMASVVAVPTKERPKEA